MIGNPLNVGILLSRATFHVHPRYVRKPHIFEHMYISYTFRYVRKPHIMEHLNFVYIPDMYVSRTFWHIHISCTSRNVRKPHIWPYHSIRKV